MVLLNELSKILVCRSSLTQSSDFLYHVIDTGGWWFGSNTAGDVIHWVVPRIQIKKVGNEGFSRGIPESKLKVIPY